MPTQVASSLRWKRKCRNAILHALLLRWCRNRNLILSVRGWRGNVFAVICKQITNRLNRVLISSVNFHRNYWRSQNLKKNCTRGNLVAAKWHWTVRSTQEGKRQRRKRIRCRTIFTFTKCVAAHITHDNSVRMKKWDCRCVSFLWMPHGADTYTHTKRQEQVKDLTKMNQTTKTK